MKVKDLDIFLESQGAFPVIKLDGFLTAINSSPKLIHPSMWLSWCGMQEINFATEKQAKDVLSMIMYMYSNINTELRENSYEPLLSLSLDVFNKKYRALPQEIIENLKLWAEGYWFGVEASWPFSENINFYLAIAAPLGMIYHLTLSENELLQELPEIVEDLVDDGEKFNIKDYYQLNLLYLPSNIIEIYKFWLQDKNNLNNVISFSNHNNKVGRNDNCPCGSGKKYKKCCLN